MNNRDNVFYMVVSLLLTFGIPSFMYLLGLIEPSQMYIVVVFIFLFSLLGWILIRQTHILNVNLINHQKTTENNFAGIREDLSVLKLSIQGFTQGSIYAVDREKVYDALRYFVQKSKQRVNLMYFGENPPSTYLHSESKEGYISDLDKLIDSRKRNIRRIILYTDYNKVWIKSIIERHKGNDRFSLYILVNEQNVPLVSAQVIDNNVAILMNFDKSITPDKPRDIVVESDKMVAVIDSYYEQMVEKSKQIIINGRVNEENNRKYLS